MLGLVCIFITFLLALCIKSRVFIFSGDKGISLNLVVLSDIRLSVIRLSVMQRISKLKDDIYHLVPKIFNIPSLFFRKICTVFL